jgi:hypothetical protein
MVTRKSVLTDEQRQKSKELLNLKYRGFLNDRFINVKDYFDAEGAYVDLTICNSDESFSYEIGSRVHKDQVSSPETAVGLLFDGLDSYLGEYFNSEESTLLPIDYADYDISEKVFQLKGQIYNRKLERLADELLRDIDPETIN